MIGYSQEVEEASIGYTGGASAYGSFDPKLDPIVESPAGAKPLNGSVNSGRSYSSGFFEQVPESSRYLVNNSNQSLPNTSRSSSSVSLEDNLANEFSKSLNISQTSNSSGVWNFKAIAPPPSFKLSRLLRFFNIPRNTDAVLFTDLCKTFGDIFSVHRANIETMGYAYIAYCDMRDAVKAFNGFPQLKLPGYGSIRVEYVQPAEFERLSMNCNFDALYLCGRSKVLVIAHNQTELDIYLPRKATEFGDVRDIQLVSGGNDSATYVCDFYDVRAAANFVAVYGNPSLPNQPFSASFVNVPNATSSANTSLYSATTTGSEPSSTKSRRKHSSRTTSSSDERLQDYDEDLTDEPLLTSSLTDPTTKVEDKLKHASLDSKTTALTTPKTYEDYKLEELGIVTKADVPKNNVIDLRRIAQGLDTRTTLMLRNIPNKVDQKMLQEYIDVTNKNTYDFLYLRIDFANKCNVGYAFISFIAPEHIITFAKARAGTKWNRFNSEKICDLSYANIYGKECLIEKFRNSSVMDQDPAYRPKVFHSDGPKLGQEQTFPSPNNINRKLRSLVSVQRVGLFPPQESRPHHWQPQQQH